MLMDILESTADGPTEEDSKIPYIMICKNSAHTYSETAQVKAFLLLQEMGHVGQQEISERKSVCTLCLTKC